MTPALMLADFSPAIRGLWRARGFTVVAILTIAMGVAGSTAIFAVANQALFRPLAVSEPDRLAMLWESNAVRGWNQGQVAPANALEWRDRVRSFSDIALVAESPTELGLTTGTGVVPVRVGLISGNALTLLGAPLALGHPLTLNDTWAEAEPVVVLGYRLWQERFGGDPGIVGRSVRLDGITSRVAGVTGPAFEYPVNDAELWTTFRYSAARRESLWFRQAHVARAIARLAPGVTMAQAERELRAVAVAMQAEHPTTNAGMDAGLTPLHQFLVGDRRLPVVVLLGAVGLLQLIACANIANLLLVRGIQRRQEMAIRAALGAGRGRLAWTVMFEAGCLAIAGALLGTVAASHGVALLAAMRPEGFPALTPHLDARVLGFTVVLSIASAILFGAYPALVSSRADVRAGLVAGGRSGTGGRSGQVTAHALTALEVALAVMLVSGAGLMVRNIMRLRQVDPGADLEHVLTFDLAPPRGTYTDEMARSRFATRILERIEQVPGVVAAGAGRSVPFGGHGWSSDFTIEGWPVDRFGVEVRHREVTPGYFRALRIPLKQGELFAAEPPVGAFPVVVNQAFVDRYFPDESPVGRRITFDRIPDSTSYWYRIVGVVGNERLEIGVEPGPEILGHLAADTPALLRFVAKTGPAPASLENEIQRAIAEVDPEVPVLRLRTMDQLETDALSLERYLMLLLGAFAVVALGLACVGVYGVAAQAARGRTREVAVRLALGATTIRVTRELAMRGLRYAAIGALAGIIGALAGGRLLQSVLYRISAADPLTLGTVCLLVTLLAGLASALAVRRVSATSPALALSSE
jgi:putative ABC transport system permease protein